jgi:hypothetical protein
MNRSDVKELYYITHIDNLKSIFQYGILCHLKAEKILYKSIADPEIQKRRNKVVIPGGKRKLHDYANLYFNARNPMMFKRKDIHKELAVLRIDSAILDEPDVVISNGNASSGYVGFYASPEGLRYLDRDLIFAEYWTDSNPIIAYRRKFAICAEVLVPDSIAPRVITGIYVSCEDTYQKVVELLKSLPFSGKILINPNLFFQEV